MAITSIDASNSADVLREARAATQSSHAGGDRPATRKSEGPRMPVEAKPAGQEAQENPPIAQNDGPSLRFHVDQDTGETVLSLVNPTNGEVLRQVPTEEALEVAKAIGKFQGMFVNLKV
jgi:flagellar protein FlaG